VKPKVQLPEGDKLLAVAKSTLDAGYSKYNSCLLTKEIAIRGRIFAV
jgi:hypothetical protein